MKAIQLLLVGGMVMMCACQPSQQSQMYTVTGELDDSTHHGKKIYVMRYDDRKLIDSTFIEGNKFVFKGQVDTASFCRIDVSYSDFANFILEGGDIKVNLKKHNYPIGTPQNEALSQIAKEEEDLYANIRKMHTEINEEFADDEKTREETRKQRAKSLKAEMVKRVEEIYATHNDDAVGYYLLGTIFMHQIDNDSQEKIMSTFGPWLKSQKVTTEKLMRLQALKKTAEGMPFVDIKGKDAEGNPVALSDYVGKGNYVLLDMWASWCGPCKGEIPNLLKLHNQYKDKGLTVLGLFVWDNEKNLKKAVEEEGIVWPQIIDTETDAEKLYGVDGIPQIILFAPDGTILNRNLRGQTMIDVVDEVMKK